MKNLTPKLFCLIMFLGSFQVCYGQKLLDKIKKAGREIESGMTEAVEQIITDKIIEKTADKIGNSIDSLFKSTYKRDSISSSERGDTLNYFDFLSGMNESENVPDEYTFDLGLEIVTTDEKGKEYNSTQYYRLDGKYLGILTEGNLVVMDAENELMATFDTKEKKGFAFGKSLMRSAGSYVQNKMFLDYSIEKGNNSKTILGHQCELYIGSSENNSFETYIAKDFPINMYDAFGKIADMFFDEKVSDTYKGIPGMSLESVSTMEDGDVYINKVKNILNTSYTIKKSDYNFELQNK